MSDSVIKFVINSVIKFW